MAAIQTVEFSTDHAWGANTGTWNDLGDFLADGLEPGIEDIITVEMGDGADEQDGVKLNGEFKVKAPGTLAAGVRTWFRFKDSAGAGSRVGGVDGCRIGLGKAAVRPLSGGPAYTRVLFSATGASGGDLVKDA